MSEIEDFEYEIIFNFICYSIKNKKTSFDENRDIYFDDAKSFFRNIVKSLESIIEEKEYFIIENLCPIVKMAGYKCSNPSKKDIKKMACGFKNTLRQLDELKQNPNRFYKKEDAPKLAILCEKIRDFYTPNYRVLS